MVYVIYDITRVSLGHVAEQVMLDKLEIYSVEACVAIQDHETILRFSEVCVLA